MDFLSYIGEGAKRPKTPKAKNPRNRKEVVKPAPAKVERVTKTVVGSVPSSGGLRLEATERIYVQVCNILDQMEEFNVKPLKKKRNAPLELDTFKTDAELVEALNVRKIPNVNGMLEFIDGPIHQRFFIRNIPEIEKKMYKVICELRRDFKAFRCESSPELTRGRGLEIIKKRKLELAKEIRKKRATKTGRKNLRICSGLSSSLYDWYKKRYGISPYVDKLENDSKSPLRKAALTWFE
jgi:hypothetical protein